VIGVGLRGDPNPVVTRRHLLDVQPAVADYLVPFLAVVSAQLESKLQSVEVHDTGAPGHLGWVTVYVLTEMKLAGSPRSFLLLSMYPRVKEHAHPEPRRNREGHSSPVVLAGEQETFCASEEAAGEVPKLTAGHDRPRSI
jgi:hypothetical protein